MGVISNRRVLAVLGLSAVVACGIGFAPPAVDTMSLEGKRAPEVVLKTADGKDFKLSSLKGSVVLMDYWATWCPPCRKSLPHVNELSKDKELTDKGLKVFAINSKEAKPVAMKFVQENNYTFAVPLDPMGKFGKDYKVQGIPTSVIVGRDGKIAKVFVGFSDGSEKELKEAIETALAVEYTPPAPATKPATTKPSAK